jgi:hypothetical protein
LKVIIPVFNLKIIKDKIILGTSSILGGLGIVTTTGILRPPKMIELTSTWCSTISLPPPDYLSGGLMVVGVVFITTGIVFIFYAKD